MKTVNYPATLLCDFYKVSHKEQYPTNTQKIFSTWTPRTTRNKDIQKIVCFGIQAFMKEWLIEYFNENFFNRPKEDVVAEYKRVITYTLGKEPDSTHIEELHDLGYMPIKITALKEGTLVPIRVPMLTIENTDDRFFWLTNYLETLMSAELWLPITSATTALQYRKILESYAKETGGDVGSVPFQGHDFSMRGMGGMKASVLSGMGHLLSFTGSDTIPAILAMEKYYNANIEKELIGSSIPATEHSVQCAGGKDEEFETYKRLINEVYPKGFCSIVSDTWDFWNVITNFLPRLKNDIMKRDGRVVVRPDSGDPVDILCGTVDLINLEHLANIDKCKDYMSMRLEQEVRIETPHGECGEMDKVGYFLFNGNVYRIQVEFEWDRHDKQYYYMDGSKVTSCEECELSPSQKGLIECLWEIFGGTITDKGYKQLDTHIGAIYGDAITLERCESICKRLKNKGFASTNVIFGIGSYSYQNVTRDTFGFALKTTYAIIDGEEKMLFKDPITDDGTKKSQKGLVVVHEEDGELVFKDGLLIEDKLSDKDDLLEVVFNNGVIQREHSLSEIRELLNKSI